MTPYLLVSLTVILALFFDFINGFHDTANAIATAVSTKALSPKRAIITASCMNFIGAILFTGVAKTIANDIVDVASIPNLTLVIIAALISAIAWNLITWYFGIPSSSSHALIGSIAGAAIVASGFGCINLNGFLNIIKSLIISPILALVVGYIVFSLFKVLYKNLNLSKANRGFRRIQVVTAAIQSFAHGTNDEQKSMGIISMALVSCGLAVSTTHVISSSIMGVGSAQSVKAVKWETGKRMVITWFITLPISAVISAIIFSIIKIFL